MSFGPSGLEWVPIRLTLETGHVSSYEEPDKFAALLFDFQRDAN